MNARPQIELNYELGSLGETGGARITGGERNPMNKHLETLRGLYEIEMQKAKSYYDFAEGISAKVKLFWMLHKRTMVFLAATHFAAIVVGVVIA
jgi:hypothetical protein